MEDETQSPILTKSKASMPSAGPSAPAAPMDLSREIVKQLTKRPSDRLTVRHISGSHYRCNWWSPGDTDGYDNPHMGGLTVTTHRVRQSQFLRVTRSGVGLSIEIVG
jgi:hypothetical protein